MVQFLPVGKRVSGLPLIEPSVKVTILSVCSRQRMANGSYK